MGFFGGSGGSGTGIGFVDLGGGNYAFPSGSNYMFYGGNGISGSYHYLKDGFDLNGGAADSFLGVDVGSAIVILGDGLNLPKATSDPTAYEEGQLRADSTDASGAYVRPRWYDGARWRHLGYQDGWCPFAFPVGFDPAGAYSSAESLAVDKCLAIPFFVPAPMHLIGIQFWNTDAATARACEISLWYQDHIGENALKLVTGTNDFSSWTPSAAAMQGISFAAGVYAPPGLVWATIRNDHASNTLGIGYAAMSTQMPINTAQTKTLTGGSLSGPTLDFTAATWAKAQRMYAAVLLGKVFGQSASF